MGREDIIKKCRVCGSDKLQKVFYLGNQYVSNFVWSEKGGIKAPLDLILCKNCSLVQLGHGAVDSNILYRNYWYKSGVNQTMKSALKNITSKVEKLVTFEKGDVVLDIGANDGTLLRSYVRRDIRRTGFEPARNLMEECMAGNDIVLNDFFNVRSYFEFIGKKARVITAIAMFYDLEDPNVFVSDLASCLHSDGVLVIQMAYQPLMLEELAFDNICHEHIEYYSMKSLSYLLDRHNLEIFDVELNDVNGGSFRTYIKHKGNNRVKGFRDADQRMKELNDKEKRMGANTVDAYIKFSRKVHDLRKKTIDFIKQEVNHGKKIYVYGASTKGNTFLQFYGLDASLVEGAADRNPLKWGLKTIGTFIPIVSEEDAKKSKPDYFLVLPWHFRKEFLKRERHYLERGGKMIFPLPKLEVVSISDLSKG